jgi:phenylalanyl-tRNA synthetase beta chain
LALVLDEEITATALEATGRAAAGQFLVRLEPFDVFRSEKLGVGKKSVALRFEFSHPDRSLTDEEVDGWINSVCERLQREHGALLR